MQDAQEADVKPVLILEDFDEAGFNPFKISEEVAGQKAVTEIFTELRRLRHLNPVHELDPRVHFGTQPDGTIEGVRKFVALGHPLVQRILGTSAEFSNSTYKKTLGKMFGRSITTMDGDEHRKYRLLFQAGFTPRMMGKFRNGMVPAIVNRVIDNFAGRGSADLVSEFALQFPFLFVMELLELPDELKDRFHRIAFCQTAIRYDYAHATEAGRKLGAYVRAMAEERRANPVSDHDFVHEICNAEVEGERLPDDVVEGFFRQLLNAAGDTSYHGFSSLMSSLLRHPDQFEAVRGDRSLVPQAIEEALRLEPPIAYLERSVFQETEIAGHVIRPDDIIFASIGDAGRDESVWENPDVFDIFRPKLKNFAFGHGSHVCVGQHLARVEMEVALNALMDRLPNLRLDPSFPEPVVRGVTMRKPAEVRVLFDT